MDFPADCTSDLDRYEYAMICHRELVKAHNQAKTAAARATIIDKLKVAGFYAYCHAKAAGCRDGDPHQMSSAETDAIRAQREAFKGSHRWQPDLGSINLIADKAQMRRDARDRFGG